MTRDTYEGNFLESSDLMTSDRPLVATIDAVRRPGTEKSADKTTIDRAIITFAETPRRFITRQDERAID